MLLVFLYFIIFLMSLSIVIMYTRPTREDKALKLRLKDIRNPRRLHTTRSDESDREEVNEPDLAGRITDYLQRYPISSKLTTLLVQSRSRLTLGSFILYSIATAILFGGACTICLPLSPAQALACLVGLAVPCCALLRTRSKLQEAFAHSLPDAMDLMARALRAGHSIQQAIELIAEQSPEPLASEFAQVHQEQKFGHPFRAALLRMSERVPLKDLRFFVTAVLVQKETGSDLIELLDRTTAVIRDRVRVAGEIKTYTAQGKLTGWILSLLPLVLLLIISILSPDYTSLLFSDPLGQKMLGAGCIMIVIGGLLIRRIVSVEI